MVAAWCGAVHGPLTSLSANYVFWLSLFHLFIIRIVLVCFLFGGTPTMTFSKCILPQKIQPFSFQGNVPISIISHISDAFAFAAQLATKCFFVCFFLMILFVAGSFFLLGRCLMSVSCVCVFCWSLPFCTPVPSRTSCTQVKSPPEGVSTAGTKPAVPSIAEHILRVGYLRWGSDGSSQVRISDLFPSHFRLQFFI